MPRFPIRMCKIDRNKCKKHPHHFGENACSHDSVANGHISRSNCPGRNVASRKPVIGLNLQKRDELKEVIPRARAAVGLGDQRSPYLGEAWR
jgi:hypothetical protein